MGESTLTTVARVLLTWMLADVRGHVTPRAEEAGENVNKTLARLFGPAVWAYSGIGVDEIIGRKILHFGADLIVDMFGNSLQ